jgi:hypothetical protein
MRHAVIVLLIWIASCGMPTRAANTEALLQALQNALEQGESKLQNLRLEGTCHSEMWNEQAQKWEYAGEASVTARYLIKPKFEARIDFHERVTRWENGQAPFGVDSYTVSYNGRLDQTLYTKKGSPEKPFLSPRGEIKSERSQSLDSECATGWAYSLWGAAEPTGLREPLSIVFSPSIRQAVQLQAKEATWNATKCIELEYLLRGLRVSWYFDPARDYALVGGERAINGQVIQNWTVHKFLEPEAGLHYPGMVKSSAWLPNGIAQSRSVYEASAVVVNDPNFRDDIFTIQWPVGTVVHDKISGITFTVGQSASDVDKAIADQVKRLKAAVRHPLTPQVKQSGGYWIPARWLAAIAVAAVAVAWLGWWARKQRK